MLRKLQKRATWDFPKIRGTILEGLYNKDYSILGSILGCPYVGKVPLVRQISEIFAIVPIYTLYNPCSFHFLFHYLNIIPIYTL